MIMNKLVHLEIRGATTQGQQLLGSTSDLNWIQTIRPVSERTPRNIGTSIWLFIHVIYIVLAYTNKEMPRRK